MQHNCLCHSVEPLHKASAVVLSTILGVTNPAFVAGESKFLIESVCFIAKWFSVAYNMVC